MEAVRRRRPSRCPLPRESGLDRPRPPDPEEPLDVPGHPPAAPAPARGAAASRARDAPRTRPARPAPLRRARAAACTARWPRCRAWRTCRRTRPRRSPRARPSAASAACCCSACRPARTSEGSSAWDDAGPVPEAIRAIRGARRSSSIATDVCLCAYTSHGHCGVLAPDGHVLNDATLPLLGSMAVAHARAGADLVAPSDMMDGRVGAIRARARRRRLRRAHGDHGLLDEVRLGLLRPVPRGRRLGPGARRPALVPDGPGQRPARACTSRCSTSTRAPTCDGQAGRPVPRRHPAPRRGHDRADRGVPGVRRARHAPRRRRSRARSTAARPRWRPSSRSAAPGLASSSPTAPSRSRVAGLVDDESARLYAEAVRAHPAAGSTRRCAPCAPSGATIRCSSSRRTAPRSSTPTATATSTTSASWGPMILGHAHPAVVEAVQRGGRARHVVRRADALGDGPRRAGQARRTRASSSCASSPPAPRPTMSALRSPAARRAATAC